MSAMSKSLMSERSARLVRPERGAGLAGARKVAVVAKTNIECCGGRHRVVVLRDGSVEAEDCPDAVEDALRLEERAERGEDIGEQRGCAALVALTTLALPKLLVGRGIRDVREFGGWLSIYVAYEENKVTRFVANACATIRDAKHAPAFEVARKAFFSLFKKGRFWRGDETWSDPEELVVFEPDVEPHAGYFVAVDRWADWTIPLQPDWLERVGAERAITDGKFVVGISDTSPNVVYALDLSCEFDGGILVREHRKVGKRLELLPLPEPGTRTADRLATLAEPPPISTDCRPPRRRMLRSKHGRRS